MAIGKGERTERREHERFRIKKSALAVLESQPATINGIIYDVSMSGLACHYFEKVAHAEKSDEKKLCTVDIFLPDKEFYLRKMPYLSIYDVEVESRMPITSVVMRRHGIRFEKLTRHHRSQLKNFIRDHTISAVKI